MSNFISLENISIASPCRASWDNMEGDDRARFCSTCHKNVYNLSEMSRSEAEALIQEKEGRLCVRFYQRDDGTILTGNCPVGLRAVQRPFKWLATGAALLVASGVALATGHDPLHNNHGVQQPANGWRNVQPIKMVMNWISPPPPAPRMVMGEIALPSPTPAPTPVPEPTESGNSTSNQLPDVR